LPQKEFLAQTMLFQGGSGEAGGLAYKIPVPKSWKKDDAVGGEGGRTEGKIMKDVARWNGPYSDAGRSWVEMKTGALEYDMTARDWLIRHMFDNGYGFQGMTVKNEKEAEALYVYVKEDETFVVRAKILLNSNEALFAAYYVPSESWEAEKSLQAQVMAGLALTTKPLGYEDKMFQYDLQGVATISYPITWALAEAEGKRNLALFNYGQVLLDGQKKLDGKMLIDTMSVTSTSSLDHEIVSHKKAFEAEGMTLGDLVEAPEGFVLNPAFDFAKTEVYQASDVNNKVIAYEYWLTVVSINNAYVFVSLLTPSRDSDYVLWAQNKAQYKAVINQLKI